MLTIARTLMGNPELLLLDEPSEGLAPLVVEALLAKIGELKAQGLTILLADRASILARTRRPRLRAGEGRGAFFRRRPARSDRSMLGELLAL